jgi:hypothetical protein
VVSGVGMAGSPGAMDDALYTMRRRAELPESEVYMVWGELGEGTVSPLIIHCAWPQPSSIDAL